MSNFDDSKFNLDNKTAKSSLTNLKWKSIQTDLQSALTEWSDAQNNDIQKTPEEVQLDKVKSMIENIKEKLNQF